MLVPSLTVSEYAVSEAATGSSVALQYPPPVVAVTVSFAEGPDISTVTAPEEQSLLAHVPQTLLRCGAACSTICEP